MDMTPDGLVTLMGVVLSLIFGYFPVAKDWFDKLDSRWKPLVMAIVLLFIAAGKLAIDCRLDTTCLIGNWERVLWVWFTALVANQMTYTVGVRQPQKAKAAWEYDVPGRE